MTSEEVQTKYIVSIRPISTPEGLPGWGITIFAGFQTYYGARLTRWGARLHAWRMIRRHRRKGSFDSPTEWEL